jgi:hypothetical protein
MPDRPKPIYKSATPGPWIFDEGEPGYPQTRMEPGDPGYPPTIFAEPPEGYKYDKDEHRIMICELNPDPIIPALDYTPESKYDEGLIAWGDSRRNGKLIAAAPDMWRMLRELRDAPEDQIRLQVAILARWAIAFEKTLETK